MSPAADPQRVVSLVPAATEYCFCYGAWDRVVGVSHECDFPPSARERPCVSRPRIDPRLPPRELNEAVQRTAANKESLWELDRPLLARLAPELVITQERCTVCGVAPKDLKVALSELKDPPKLFNLDAANYEEVVAGARNLGHALGLREEAKQLQLKNWGLAKEIRRQSSGLGRPRVAIIDWVDPLMFAGNWIPELAQMAGGDYRLVPQGQPSRWGSWEELEEYEADVIVVAPCGRSPAETEEDLRAAVRAHGAEQFAAVLNDRVFAADGNAYFNRPGPRLIYSAGLMARAFHWEEIPPLPPTIEAGLRRVSFNA